MLVAEDVNLDPRYMFLLEQWFPEMPSPEVDYLYHLSPHFCRAVLDIVFESLQDLNPSPRIGLGEYLKLSLAPCRFSRGSVQSKALTRIYSQRGMDTVQRILLFVTCLTRVCLRMLLRAVLGTSLRFIGTDVPRSQHNSTRNIRETSQAEESCLALRHTDPDW